MKVKVKNVYYCEYCGKRRLIKHIMEKHEQGCTLNPNRKCKLCERTAELEEIIIPDIKPLINKFKKIAEEKTVAHDGWIEQSPTDVKIISDEVNGCPNCILAIIRQSEIINATVQQGEAQIRWDYKKALEEYWTISEEEWEDMQYKDYHNNR